VLRTLKIELSNPAIDYSVLKSKWTSASVLKLVLSQDSLCLWWLGKKKSYKSQKQKYRRMKVILHLQKVQQILHPFTSFWGMWRQRKSLPISRTEFVHYYLHWGVRDVPLIRPINILLSAVSSFPLTAGIEKFDSQRRLSFVFVWCGRWSVRLLLQWIPPDCWQQTSPNILWTSPSLNYLLCIIYIIDLGSKQLLH